MKEIVRKVFDEIFRNDEDLIAALTERIAFNPRRVAFPTESSALRDPVKTRTLSLG